MTEITDHLAVIERRVAQALLHAGRAETDILLIAVSKGQPAAAIAAASAAGVCDFGENYVDEALEKMDSLADLDIRWHFIGRIQSNKTRTIAERFDWVHTVDRERIAARLNSQRPDDKSPLNVLIQVNLANESQKGGVPAIGLPPLAAAIDGLQHLRLRGLMTIPPAGFSATEAAAHFLELAALQESLSSAARPLDTLSMGMSGDFETAIACGSSCVRIGTAIFGRRVKPRA